jgi:putative transposase
MFLISYFMFLIPYFSKPRQRLPALFIGFQTKVQTWVTENLGSNMLPYKNRLSMEHLPCKYAPWQTVYWYFRKWTLDGIIELAHWELRRALRKKSGRNQSASLGIIDSHNVRMSSISGQQRGIDGNKKIKGSKRHIIIVYTKGLIICVVAHPANIHDNKGAKEVVDGLYDLRFEEQRLKKYQQMAAMKVVLKLLKKRLGIVLEGR